MLRVALEILGTGTKKMLGIVIYKYYMYKLSQYIFYIISTESALYVKRPKVELTLGKDRAGNTLVSA